MKAKWNVCAAGLLVAGLALSGGARTILAQGEVVPNPVSATVKAQLGRYQKNIVAAAESMPAEKYGFKPTPEMSTFGHVVLHIMQSNNNFCSKIAGEAAPDLKLAEVDGKDKLILGLKKSFEYCSAALADKDDAKLGEQIPLFGGQLMPRAVAWIALSDGWNDHYGQLAIYLRLNGILPPTAQADKK